MKRTSLLLSLALLIGLSTSGCMIVASPMLGTIYTEAKYGDTATDASGASKEGKACGQSILGWVATGDASVSTAKTTDNITTITIINHSAKNILGIIGEWCTIVRGN